LNTGFFYGQCFPEAVDYHNLYFVMESGRMATAVVGLAKKSH